MYEMVEKFLEKLDDKSLMEFIVFLDKQEFIIDF